MKRLIPKAMDPGGDESMTAADNDEVAEGTTAVSQTPDAETSEAEVLRHPPEYWIG